MTTTLFIIATLVWLLTYLAIGVGWMTLLGAAWENPANIGNRPETVEKRRRLLIIAWLLWPYMMVTIVYTAISAWREGGRPWN